MKRCSYCLVCAFKSIFVLELILLLELLNISNKMLTCGTLHHVLTLEAFLP